MLFVILKNCTEVIFENMKSYPRVVKHKPFIFAVYTITNMEFTIPDTGGHSAIFYASQSPMLIIGTDAPGYTMLDVNNAYLQATHTEREDLIGKSVFGFSRPILLIWFLKILSGPFIHLNRQSRADCHIPCTITGMTFLYQVPMHLKNGGGRPAILP